MNAPIVGSITVSDMSIEADNREYTLSWRLWLGLCLISTCALAPLGVLLIVLESRRKAQQRKARATALLGSLLRRSAVVPALVARGPSDRLRRVQVAPTIDYLGLSMAVHRVPHCLTMEEVALVLAEASEQIDDPLWVLITDQRTCLCAPSNLKPGAARFTYDFPHAEVESILTFSTPTGEMLWIDGCPVASFSAQQKEKVRTLARWVRALVGRRLPASLYCPRCDSDDVDVLLNAVEMQELDTYGSAMLLDFIKEVVTAAAPIENFSTKTPVMRRDEQRALQGLRGRCATCGHGWQHRRVDGG